MRATLIENSDGTVTYTHVDGSVFNGTCTKGRRAAEVRQTLFLEIEPSEVAEPEAEAEAEAEPEAEAEAE